MINFLYIFILLPLKGVLCNQNNYYNYYMPILGEYKSYDSYVDNNAYIKELDHIVNYRVSKLKTSMIELARNLYDARNYDLQSLSQEVNERFNEFINKMLASYSVVTSMGYHFEILIFEYKRATMKLTKKMITQGEDLLSDESVRAMTYFTVKRLDKLFTEIMLMTENLSNEWERIKVYVTRGVSEMDHQSVINQGVTHQNASTTNVVQQNQNVQFGTKV